MYPRNAASPERIALGAVIQVSDGAVQTSGVTVSVMPQGGTEAVGGGTISYGLSGGVRYLPTQAETNHTSFIVSAYKAGCIPVAVTVVTTASQTPGTVQLAPVVHTGATVPTVTTLSGHTAQTGDAFARLGAPAGASVSADIATRLPTSSYTAPPAAATVAGAVRTELATELGRIDVAVSSVSGGGGGTAPTAAAVAGAVRAELSTELARMDAPVSSRSTYAGADTPGMSTLLSRVAGQVLLASGYTAPPAAESVADAVQSRALNIGAINGVTKAAQHLAIHAPLAVPVTFAAGGTLTTAVLATVDGAPASSVNDAYKGAALIFTGPSGLQHQRSSITDYNGATKTATITAVTQAPTATATAVLV